MTTRITSIQERHVASEMRGFTLLIAVILASVILSIGLSLLDISYKQVTLASTARQSQYAFYNADSAVECALYWDSVDQFDYSGDPQGVSPTLPSGQIHCENQSFNYYDAAPSGGSRTTTFSIPCGDSISGDSVADVTIIKLSTGGTSIYANGYNVCSASSPNRVQRGEEAHY